jgi:hypothetical protein
VQEEPQRETEMVNQRKAITIEIDLVSNAPLQTHLTPDPSSFAYSDRSLLCLAIVAETVVFSLFNPPNTLLPPLSLGARDGPFLNFLDA